MTPITALKASGSGRLTRDTYWIGGWTHSRAGLHIWRKEDYLVRRPAVLTAIRKFLQQAALWHYANLATPTPVVLYVEE
jgi:hypothetical protein